MCIRDRYLTHEYAEKKQQEAEEQRSIREQMREEEKAQRELERAQVESERDAEKYRLALEKVKRDAEKSQGEKLNKLNSEIERLNSLLVEATARKERAISNAQLTRSGYVYTVSYTHLSKPAILTSLYWALSRDNAEIRLIVK